MAMAMAVRSQVKASAPRLGFGSARGRAVR